MKRLLKKQHVHFCHFMSISQTSCLAPAVHSHLDSSSKHNISADLSGNLHHHHHHPMGPCLGAHSAVICASCGTPAERNHSKAWRPPSREGSTYHWTSHEGRFTCYKTPLITHHFDFDLGRWNHGWKSLQNLCWTRWLWWIKIIFDIIITISW